jgi:hypothetical protein
VKTLVTRLRVALFVLSLSSIAAAQDKKACLAAVDEGQNLRDQGKLQEARAQFQICTSRSCPAAVTKQCSDWFNEVEKDQPSVLFRAKDAAGKEIVDVKVLVDGERVADSIGGQPLLLDPSEHAIRFERKDGTSVEDRFVLRVGEKERMIELTFPAPAPPPEPPAEKPKAAPARSFEIPLLGWVGGGVFVAGAATAVIFAVTAHGDESDLRSTCAPNCAAGDRDAIQTKLVVANVGMFVGIAGLALAGVTTFLANRPEKQAANGLHVGLTANGIGGEF